MTVYNTNLASEFHVLSMLYRRGADASLTLGNKKAVDIVVALPSGQTVTIDVKGVAGPHDWPCDNLKFPASAHHFIALVSFEGKMANPCTVPSVWLVPANEITPFVKSYAVRKVIVRSAVRIQGKPYWQAWWRIVEEPSAVCPPASSPYNCHGSTEKVCQGFGACALA
jgi:hypothetical protein